MRLTEVPVKSAPTEQTSRNAHPDESDTAVTCPSTIGAPVKSVIARTLAVSAMALAPLAFVVPTASAIDYPGPSDETQNFTTPFAPGGQGKSVIISPFGTSQKIECSSFHGQGWCTQTDPAGATHNLTELKLPTGSSDGGYLPIYIYNP